MFINLSNHSSDQWGNEQLMAASEYGDIVDISFPRIDPHSDSGDIDSLVDRYFDMVIAYGMPTVMLQGEFIFTYRLVNKLKSAGLKVLAGRSERRTVECVNEKGIAEKKSKFVFAGFMEY